MWALWLGFIHPRYYAFSPLHWQLPLPPKHRWRCLLSSAGFGRCCSSQHVRRRLWNEEPSWRQHPSVVCCRLVIISDCADRHHCLMLSDWVLLNYSNTPFRRLTRLPDFIYQIRRRMIWKWASFHGTIGGKIMWQGGIQGTIQGVIIWLITERGLCALC